MACEVPCLDCPFLRGADKLILENSSFEDFVEYHLSSEEGYQTYFCTEQEDICVGWLQMIANGSQIDVEEFPHISDHIALMERNYKDYWKGIWEFLENHD